MPITPKGAKRYLRFNATRKGLLGGSRLWLAVWAVLKAKGFAGKVTKRGEPQLAYSKKLNQGHWFEIVHENPPPTRKAKRKARKAVAKADTRRAVAEADPTRRNINRALRAGRAATKRNRQIGPARSAVPIVALADAALTRGQRRRRSKIGVTERSALEELDAARHPD